jgi:hypothetical protein
MSNRKSIGRAKTRDVAFTFRMNAGSPGEVNRSHPMSIEPALNEATGANPLTYFGQAALVDSTNNAVRAVNNTSDSALGNTSAAIYGVLVRPFPFQSTGNTETYGAEGFGVGGPPASAAVDVLKSGYILVQVNKVGGSTAIAPKKGSAVYVRVANGGTGYPVGGFESTADGTATNQFTVSNAVFNGPADANGVAEIIIRD